MTSNQAVPELHPIPDELRTLLDPVEIQRDGAGRWVWACHPCGKHLADVEVGDELLTVVHLACDHVLSCKVLTRERITWVDIAGRVFTADPTKGDLPDGFSAEVLLIYFGPEPEEGADEPQRWMMTTRMMGSPTAQSWHVDPEGAKAAAETELRKLTTPQK